MKRSLLFVALLGCFTVAFAQSGDQAKKYAAIITGENLKKHLSIIAGDEMEGRETGTEGQRKAAAYIEAQFKELGLKAPEALNGYQQLYPLHKASMKTSVVKLDNKELVYGTDYYVPVVNNGDKTITAGKFVFAGYGISEAAYDDYKGLDVTGKVVVMFLGEPKAEGKYLVSGTEIYSKYTRPGVASKLKIAKQKGAVGAVFINPAIDSISTSTVTANSKSDVYYPNKLELEGLDYLVMSHKAVKSFFPQWSMDSLIRVAKSYAAFTAAALPETSMPYSFDYKKEKVTVNASNVLGVIEGTDKKDEYVFLTAHYDHLGIRNGKIYYGADDDGSGTCAVINMAQAFAKAKAAGKGPRRTIVFMTVSGEEKGLWGSKYYSDNPVFPLDKTSVDLNTDMVGRVDTERSTADSLNYVYVIGHDKLSSELPTINEGVNKKYTGLVLDYKYDDPKDKQRIYYRSDHYNFARKGVPILFFYDGMLKADYHKPTDTIEKINWELYEKRVRMIFHTAWEMANRNDMLKRDTPLPSEDNDD
jgi:Zn-dependent M28 family amino/carboxypeptidase